MRIKRKKRETVRGLFGITIEANALRDK